MHDANCVRVRLLISADEYLRVYRGTARTVVAQSLDGRTIHFPVNLLQPFVTRDGVSGEFTIYFDEQRKFLRIEKV